jgi:hypothetical protein
MQIAYGVRQGHVEGFRSKERRTFRAELFMFRNYLQEPKRMQK